ncbi:MAG: hypothetical protein CMJ51_06360 [Planctomycetaceae bacterium]|nr:hypothetical protein [Planctomycetaceae bacterium]
MPPTPSILTSVSGRARIAGAWLLLLVPGTIAIAGFDDPGIDSVPSFNREIRPILARCLACHGPDAAARKADLRLDQRGEAIGDRRGGAAIVPGDPAASSLLTRVLSRDPESVMPPPGAGTPLDHEEIRILERWIAAGAPYETHWSWVHPEASPPPPSVEGSWAIRDLDRYVSAAHRDAGVSPNPPAELAIACRRVSLDLVGLPPSPERLREVIALAGRIGETAAYEAFVDELLLDPAFGERWARVWLDVARYADTRGYEADRRRTMWPWRDWVIRAFNTDLPYDRFTIEQLAGDLLPEVDEDAVLATAFHRNTMTNDEGGTRDEEFRIAAVTDRVNTTLTAWMGLTAECAACHDHKYDPISTEEYYRLFAFFNTTQDADRNDEQPLLAYLSHPDRIRREGLEAERRVLERNRIRVALAAGSRTRESTDATGIPPGRVPLLADVRPPAVIAGDGLVADDFPWDDTVEPPPGWHRARRIDAGPDTFRQHYIEDFAPSARPVIQSGDRLEVWVRIDPRNPPAAVMIQVRATDGDWEHRAYWGESDFPWGEEGTGSRRRLGGLPSGGEWASLVFDPRDVDLASGVGIIGLACSLQGGSDGGGAHFGPVSIVRADGSPPAWSRDADSWITAEAEVGGRHLSATLRAAVLAGDERDPDATTLLQSHWAATVRPSGIAASRPSRAELERVKVAAAAIEDLAIEVPVLREQAEEDRRRTHVLQKGDWRSPGRPVIPGVPAFLHSIAPGDEIGADRLDLARWIADERNPLTARVHVNRVWERLFGRGLVETQEDFGTQGVPPRHQGLLDHLARRFMDEGWSHKALCREIATSATYRQSSAASPEVRAEDPDNDLLARGPRFRLEAEALRDSALAVSQRLTTELYGPPVFPPQPDGVWQVVYSGDQWSTAVDEDRYRRGLYTFWRRTAPHPAMLTFDAGSRETCSVRRIRTNTPLQALVLLNDETFVEAAGGLALISTPAGDGSRDLVLRDAFRRALSREPEDAELDVLRELHRREETRFRERPDAVARLLEAARIDATDGRDPAGLAAMVVVCNVILNLDEFVTRG